MELFRETKNNGLVTFESGVMSGLKPTGVQVRSEHLVQLYVGFRRLWFRMFLE